MQEEFACSLHMDSIINSSQDSPAEGAKCKRAPLWKVISLAKLIIFSVYGARLYRPTVCFTQ